MLELKGLTIRQDDFSLQADAQFGAGFTTLIGPSGGGKSTLLDTIAGFITPSAGQVFWNGENITGLAPAKRPVSILFQDNNLFPHLTITANLALALTMKRPTEQQRSVIDRALREVGLDGMGNRKPAELSGGQQGRAALARVLLQDRPLMLLDEPFAALGPALRAEMLALVARLAGQKGIAVIMVSHAPEDALRVAEETSVVADGRVTVPQPTASLFDDPPDSLRAYLGT
ncbi:ATP-binding cassette domain-containing protein [Primorskyibacter aestuariivivens]|uniref:thiamine ABC transporter ATP-binding protein n=1 Tax=Primorskyibacter aestuariivivens TaxID=1888912 RepID=UPI0023003A64|nr:ATP-binding cassette domain-containing protein [Primorskyibacter aestuariivivens]MDA7427832.1 ATP-binding cassette domain-containing protein [Primorskyibacter aestuariivivens]